MIKNTNGIAFITIHALFTLSSTLYAFHVAKKLTPDDISRRTIPSSDPF